MTASFGAVPIIIKQIQDNERIREQERVVTSESLANYAFSQHDFGASADTCAEIVQWYASEVPEALAANYVGQVAGSILQLETAARDELKRVRVAEPERKTTADHPDFELNLLKTATVLVVRGELTTRLYRAEAMSEGMPGVKTRGRLAKITIDLPNDHITLKNGFLETAGKTLLDYKDYDKVAYATRIADRQIQPAREIPMPNVRDAGTDAQAVLADLLDPAIQPQLAFERSIIQAILSRKH